MTVADLNVAGAAGEDPKVAAKIQDFAAAASNGNVAVFLDFDRTATRCLLPDGRRVVSSVAVIEKSPLMSQAYRDKGEECFNTYFPIEISDKLTVEEKLPEMEKWYSTMFTLTIAEGVTDAMVDQIVEDADTLVLRDGVPEFLRLCQESDPPIPVMIVSAGLGNTIEKFFRRVLPFELKPSTVIFSNRLIFGEDGKATGFTQPLLHMFNKTAKTLPEAAFKLVEKKTHCLVIGDNPGDATMADGVDCQTMKVGFLNENLERLGQYKEIFDVVITGDPDFPEILFQCIGHPREMNGHGEAGA